ncbi:hypothetical protein BKA82DRAFT_4098164 [Pisolithus tinctorius]|nr:hypothetical protein BKA82DRAFT_4098164 [Pisolithus tinctorius]
MSSDLQWLLLRNYNSFMVKRGPEGKTFSAEHTIDIKDSGSGIQITTRKSKVSPHAIRSARTTLTIRNRSGPRRAFGVVAGLAKRGYRPDLRAAALARTSALIAAQNEKKPALPKKLRGRKATARS